MNWPKGTGVQAMGNREFHYLRRVLTHRQAQRRFPILAANLEDLRRSTETWWAAEQIVTVGSYRIGFTAVTPRAVSPWSGVGEALWFSLSPPGDRAAGHFKKTARAVPRRSAAVARRV